MQFNSYEFILLFLPVTVVLYYAANRIRPVCGKLVLIAASIVFYGYGRVPMLSLLGVSLVLNYLFVLLIRKRGVRNRWALAVPVAINVGLLLYFKYLNFAIANVNALLHTAIGFREMIVPIGISFYTFQQIAYVVAVWNGELEGSGLIDYLTYILYFPKLLMGPLADPVDFISQLNQEGRRRFDARQLAIGLKLFSFGLLKKVLLADTFVKAVNWGMADPNAMTAGDCLLFMLCYSFQLYFDFSGYSDMATGISAMLNLDLPINFDSPYKASSERDMWRRWHISLTRFLTKYIYIPLGGSRKGKLFTWLNTVLVFLISGLWHGASWNYVAWGFLHGVFSCVDRELARFESKIWKPLRWLCTFALWNVLTLLFGVGSVRLWLSMMLKTLRMQIPAISHGLIASFQTVEWQILSRLPGLKALPVQDGNLIQMLLFLFAACLICFVPQNNYRNKDRLTCGSMVLASVCFIWGVLCLGAESTFVYFGF